MDFPIFYPQIHLMYTAADAGHVQWLHALTSQASVILNP